MVTDQKLSESAKEIERAEMEARTQEAMANLRLEENQQVNKPNLFTCLGRTYTKIGTIQRRLAWPLRKDDTQNREAFQKKKKKKLPHCGLFWKSSPFTYYNQGELVRFAMYYGKIMLKLDVATIL